MPEYIKNIEQFTDAELGSVPGITIYRFVIDDIKNRLPESSERDQCIRYLEDEISNARRKGHQVGDAISEDVRKL